MARKHDAICKNGTAGLSAIPIRALIEKRCGGLHAQAEADLEITRRHIAIAEKALGFMLTEASSPSPDQAT